MPVRALLRAVMVDEAIAPYHTIQLKIFYPALDAQTDEQRDTGILPFAPVFAPAPLVIFLPGVNCSPHTYEWLASDLAEHGIVTIIADWVAQNLAGRTSITPGIRLSALKPDVYGQVPTSTSLPVIFDALHDLRNDPTIGNAVQWDAIFLGGHSAGGTIALQNARHDWFPQVIGAFAYGANPLATAVLGGWERNTIPPQPTDVPVLIMGGTLDGIGDHHNRLFGDGHSPATDTIMRSFREPQYQHSILCIFEGANHHTICYPPDHTIGRIFLDTPAQGDEEQIRHAMGQLIAQFIQRCFKQGGEISRPHSAVIWETN